MTTYHPRDAVDIRTTIELMKPGDSILIPQHLTKEAEEIIKANSYRELRNTLSAIESQRDTYHVDRDELFSQNEQLQARNRALEQREMERQLKHAGETAKKHIDKQIMATLFPDPVKDDMRLTEVQLRNAVRKHCGAGMLVPFGSTGAEETVIVALKACGLVKP